METWPAFSPNRISQDGIRRYRHIALELEKNWDHSSATDREGLNLYDLVELISYCDSHLRALLLEEPVSPVPENVSRIMDVLRPRVLERRARETRPNVDGR